jgi:GLPGLI family protein
MLKIMIRKWLKTVVLLLIIACFVAPLRNANAQIISQYTHDYIGEVTVLDSAKLRIMYSLDYMPDSLKPKQILKDRKTLLIGEKLNCFYSYYTQLKDSAVTVDEKKWPDLPANWKDEGAKIYTYHATKERTVIEYITHLSIYRYQEPIEKFQWQLSADTCTILSCSCLKATTHFRGRDWEVWFTMDIPIDAGPWKFCGLPGLIMKASDSRGHYVYECIGIEQLVQKKEPIVMGKKTYTDCTRAVYIKAQKQFYENYVNALLALGICVMIVDDNGKEIELIKTPNTKFAERNAMLLTSVNVRDRNRKIPYNPIELE